MQIVISTLALMGKSAEEVIQLAQQYHWALEFSSGMPYRADMEVVFLNAPIKKYAHNYFSAPEIPFVLNLASANEKIRNQSIAHCLKGLELSKLAGAAFFSAHAGFCVDPHPDELGRKLALTNSFDRDGHWKIFIESIKKITDRAGELGMKFLIENNVLASVNVHPNGSNPLLCCDADEMLVMLKEVNMPNLALLIDTGHLKVSSKTLKFNLNDAVEKLIGKVACVHHSDNDGNFDTNDKMNSEYWFLPYMRNFPDSVHVIEVKKLTPEEIDQQIKILQA